jgi:hypothetical protein
MMVMADVSASMSGLPMQVAVGLAILISGAQSGALKDRWLTFSCEPHVQINTPGASLHKLVSDAMEANWGMSTDFEKAMELILRLCVDNAIPQDKIPKMLVVITDMQWNEALGGDYGSKKTSYDAEVIQRRWRTYGYDAPHLLFWNVRASANPVYQAKTTTKGVSMLSGFSQQILTALLEGVDLDTLEGLTPWETLKAILDRDRYSVVDEIVDVALEKDAAVLW